VGSYLNFGKSFLRGRFPLNSGIQRIGVNENYLDFQNSIYSQKRQNKLRAKESVHK
jgi:hypothetical protein